MQFRRIGTGLFNLNTSLKDVFTSSLAHKSLQNVRYVRCELSISSSGGVESDMNLIHLGGSEVVMEKVFNKSFTDVFAHLS